MQSILVSIPLRMTVWKGTNMEGMKAGIPVIDCNLDVIHMIEGNGACLRSIYNGVRCGTHCFSDKGIIWWHGECRHEGRYSWGNVCADGEKDVNKCIVSTQQCIINYGEARTCCWLHPPNEDEIVSAALGPDSGIYNVQLALLLPSS